MSEPLDFWVASRKLFSLFLRVTSWPFPVCGVFYKNNKFISPNIQADFLSPVFRKSNETAASKQSTPNIIRISLLVNSFRVMALVYVIYALMTIQGILFALYFTGKGYVIGMIWEIACVILRVWLYVFESATKWIFPPQRKNIRGEIALVTGAASGIGRLIALGLAAKGLSSARQMNITPWSGIMPMKRARPPDLNFSHFNFSTRNLNWSFIYLGIKSWQVFFGVDLNHLL